MTADIKNKMAAKYEVEKEIEARQWMEGVVGEPLSNQTHGPDGFHESLKDGAFLAKMANQLGGKIKVNTSKMAFKQMESIGQFLAFCETYGLVKTDLFQTVDLYEKQNMWQVVITIHALGRKAQTKGFQGPTLGPKESKTNVREFTEEQMRAGEGVIGLQAGTNQVASQAGMSFGAQRHINDIKVGDASREGQNVIGLQMGSNKGATQAGQNFGKPRGLGAPDM